MPNIDELETTAITAISQIITLGRLWTRKKNVLLRLFESGSLFGNFSPMYGVYLVKR